MPSQSPSAGARTMSIGGATFDLFVRTGIASVPLKDGVTVPELPLGGKIRVEEVIGTCGGGASNTSVGLKRLGCNAGFCGVVASDQWGTSLLENLRKEGVDTSCITVIEGETSSFSIILTVENGERVILYDSGTNAHLHDVTFDREAVARADWVYLNRIQEQSCVIEDDLLAMFVAEKSPHLTWNPGGCHIETGMGGAQLTALVSHCHLLLLNKEEALTFTKTKDTDTAFRQLLAAGAKRICITDGGRGVLATDGEHLYHCPPVAGATIVDTTGAGDAFGTGATWALLSGIDLPGALRAGTMNATSVIGAWGAQAGLLTDIEMRHRLSSTPLDVKTLPLPR
ncbi:MAG: carbohydrate kinase family protein [Candidatus Peregrinibacteria bacterium]|nr:carbohydrate kinase family protein [Candidatus Peregrinibacteria bacterium]